MLTSMTTGSDDAQAAAAPAPMPLVVIISGLSGGGKTAAAKLCEDVGFTVVDNLPGELLPNLAAMAASDPRRFARLAIVLDVRAGDASRALAATRAALESHGIRPTVFYLEARDDVLVRRFSETRQIGRAHV